MPTRRSSDAPYKVLFQDPGLFEETVRLVAPKLADALDFETAASLDKEHLTESARTRLQDKLRRVEFKTGELRNGRRRYVLVLTEFQSSQDQDMAWRMREYLHLVEAELRETGAEQAEGAVPPMLAIVVHNGERPWRATAQWAPPLTGDGPPAPARMYATVDLQVLAQGRDPEGRALAPGSRLAMLAELEAASAERLPGLLLAAFRRYDGPESAGLRRGLHVRVEAALTRLEAGEELPPLEDLERWLARRRGADMVGMLDATLERWQEANIARGRAEGEAHGRAEGEAHGRAEGEARGRAEGRADGEARGRIALLRRLATRRFGADVAGQVTALLAEVRDVAQLDEAGDWLVECDTGDALLARLREQEETGPGESAAVAE